MLFTLFPLEMMQLASVHVRLSDEQRPEMIGNVLKGPCLLRLPTPRTYPAIILPTGDVVTYQPVVLRQGAYRLTPKLVQSPKNDCWPNYRVGPRLPSPLKSGACPGYFGLCHHPPIKRR